MGKRLVKLLDVSEADNIGLEFQVRVFFFFPALFRNVLNEGLVLKYNSEDRPPVNKFLSIQSIPTSSFRSTFQSTNPGPPNPPAAAPRPFTSSDAFGGFGTGAGIGGWKGGRKQ